MKTNYYKLEQSTKEDIENRILELAKNYTPEWIPNMDRPDVGTTLGILYAKHMSENIAAYNSVVDKCQVELANMLGINLIPPTPASSAIQFHMIHNTIPGVMVKRRTKLYADGEEAPVIYETKHPLYVTGSDLTDLVMIEGTSGKYVSILGSSKEQQLIEEALEEDEIALLPKSEEDTNITRIVPFSLFDFSENNISKNVFLIYQKQILDIENQDIYIKVDGNNEFLKKIVNGEFELSYYTENGFEKINQLSLEGNILRIKKDKECRKIKDKNNEYSVLAIESKKIIKEPIEIEDISFASVGDWSKASFSNNTTTDFDVNQFEPFGNTLSLFQEWQFGHREYFAKNEAKASVKFHAEFKTFTAVTEAEKPDESLKIIKRIPRRRVEQYVADAYIDEIALEYFNGTSWKRLECDKDVKKMFARAKDGDYEFSFIVPNDWKELGDGEEQNRNLRIRIIRSDNCYLMPCNHHYPVITNLMMSYTYEDRYMKADKLERISELTRYSLDREYMLGKKLTIFTPGIFSENSLMLGLSKKPEEGPVSIYFELDENSRFKGMNLKYEYSTPHGFKELSVEDCTKGLSQTGVIRFMPPEDMDCYEIENVRACFIKIICRDVDRDNKDLYPTINNILLNVVEIENVVTHEKENFFLPEISNNMHVSLGYEGIYEAEIWVNEFGTFSKEEYRRLIDERPEDVLIEKDIWGEIQNVFVKWEEVNDFYQSTSKDRHYILDRIDGEVIFGDGVHVKIPRLVDKVSFFANISTCDGKAGNNEIGEITGVSNQLRFIDAVENIQPSVGGCDMESILNALNRATNLISNRRRLVTLSDYEKEICAMSESIDQVVCVRDTLITGEYCEGDISFVVLMKSLMESGRAFETIMNRISNHIYECSALSIPKEKIHFVEPLRVHISADIWIRQNLEDDDFDTRRKIKDAITEFLDPIRGNRGSGYEIGKMPRRIQIENRLDELNLKKKIVKIVLNAEYTDCHGKHECSLEDLPENPYFICCNGVHRIKGFTHN